MNHASMNQVSMNQAQTNPEFTKWWRRWVSRVQRMSMKRAPSARRQRADELRRRNSSLQAYRGTSHDCEFKRHL